MAEEFRRETEGSWPRPVVDMLLDAWGATMGRPAFITSAVTDILGSARSFRQWVADHAGAFLEGPASHADAHQRPTAVSGVGEGLDGSLLPQPGG
jgi:hypothetical protein